MWTLDKTVTAMGGRMLRSWIERPLLDKAEIEARLDAVAHLKGNAIGAESLREQLRGVYDVERLLSRIAYDSVTPRECLSLARSLSAVPYVKDLLRGMDAGALSAVDALLDPMEALVALPYTTLFRSRAASSAPGTKRGSTACARRPPTARTGSPSSSSRSATRPASRTSRSVSTGCSAITSR